MNKLIIRLIIPSMKSSYVLKTPETQENYGPKMVPYTFPVEASKNLKNLSNNTMNLASPIKKHKAFDTKNDDIKGFDGVFKLINATMPIIGFSLSKLKKSQALFVLIVKIS